jgi:hypothetical protein
MSEIEIKKFVKLLILEKTMRLKTSLKIDEKSFRGFHFQLCFDDRRN